MSSIAREGVEPKISIDHAVKVYKEKTLLFIYIKESREKPVHLRGKGRGVLYKKWCIHS